MMFCQTAIHVSDSSQVGEVRRQANRLAVEAGLNETDCGKVSIVATELANNIARYAPGGEVLLRSLGQPLTSGIEILAVDRGPGMQDTSQCLTDGFSSGGTAGQGLGAVQRMSTEFDLFSSQPTGTVVFCAFATRLTPTRLRKHLLGEQSIGRRRWSNCLATPGASRSGHRNWC